MIVKTQETLTVELESLNRQVQQLQAALTLQKRTYDIFINNYERRLIRLEQKR